jgi:carbon storage regulator
MFRQILPTPERLLLGIQSEWQQWIQLRRSELFKERSCRMLVLSRKTGETIQVAGQTGEIRITVVQIRGGRVRLSIDAPREVRVMRSELADTEQPDVLPVEPALQHE